LIVSAAIGHPENKYANDVYFSLTTIRRWRINVAVKIVQTTRYLKDLKRIGASTADIERLEQMIAANPYSGDVIPGPGGIRKIRFALGNKGKRGGGRAIYFLMVADDQAVMLFAYSKSAKEDITSAEKKAVLALMKEITDGEN
jgi:hypothetical protein